MFLKQTQALYILLHITLKDSMIYEYERAGVINLHLRDFGKDGTIFSEASAKVMYLLQGAAMINGLYFSYYEDSEFYDESIDNIRTRYKAVFMQTVAELKETEEYKRILETIQEVIPACKDLHIIYGEGHIDHQSQPYGGFDEWISDLGITSIKDFIFGNVALKCTWD